MDEYKSNSHRSKTEPVEEKKVEKVVFGTAKTRKRKGLLKLADVFLARDVDSVKTYILKDVIIPAITKALHDVMTNGADMLFYGEVTGVRRNSSASKISYVNYSDRKNNDRESHSPRAKTGFSYDDIVFDNRGDVEEVLNRMDELLDRFGIVSVADFYDLAGVSTGNYTTNKYGWTDLSSANVVHVRDGYILKLPRAMPIN